MQRVVRWVALGAVLAFAPVASSALARPAKAAKAAAKKEAKEGKRAFDLGRFDEALKHYEEAYRLLPVPALFFNIAQCHRQLGNDERASYFFRRYLESHPPAAQARATEKLLAEVEAGAAAKKKQQEADAETARQMELQKARADAAHAEAEAAEKRRSAEEAEAKKQEAERNAALAASLKGPPTVKEENVPVTRRWWFWTAIGAAVAAGVGTVAYVATAPTPQPTTYPDINGR